MPVSPRDFELYSRVTGAAMPSDAMSRMKMAPEVYEFTKNFGRQPNLLQKTGNLVKNIGKGAVLAVGAPVAAIAMANEEQKAEALRNEIDKETADAATPEISDETPELTAIEKGELAKQATETLRHNNEMAKLAQQHENAMAFLGAKTGGTQEPTTADSYGQPVVENQTGEEMVDRSIEQGSQIANTERPIQSEILSESQDSVPAVSVDSIESIGSAVSKEQLDKFISREGLKDDPASKILLGAIDEGDNTEEMIGTSFPLASIIGEDKPIGPASPLLGHPDMEPGESHSNVPTQKNIKERQGISTTSTADLDELSNRKEMRKIAAQERIAEKSPSSKQIELTEQNKQKNVKTPSVSGKSDDFLDNLVSQAKKDLQDPDEMMNKPSFSYKTTRAGRSEVGITEGGDIYQIFQNEPSKTYITKASPRQAEMFQEMLPEHLTDDRDQTPGAGGFLTAFTKKTFDF
tara:strand:- start:4903 stop:6291 length:1389 start_codon:yes stop_codon:yes gene_type:complete